MCGIAGIANFHPSRVPDIGTVKEMCRVLAHRGPDDEGVDIREGVALGMRRLSIIDLAGGKQPIFNEDGTIGLVFNGEIYNFQDLRVQLRKSGHVFRTSSDTEVILHAYEEYGEKFLNHLNGMFAIAIHDRKKRKVILARDPIGIKPLYFSVNGDGIVWGSEIKAILASGFVNPELDIDSLGEFLAWEYVPGTRTLFKSIFKLSPGEMIRVELDDSSWSKVEYWDVPPEDRFGNPKRKDWEDLVDDTITTCVRRQMVSDVPLGAFLSGGVDSSTIVASMGNAKAFSIGFDDPSYNELGYARKVARYLGIDHIVEVLQPDIEELFHSLMDFMDDPIGDFSIFPTFLVSKMARRHVKVVLSGDGGDELFGGYETYVAEKLSSRYSSLPECLRKTVIEPLVNSMKPTSSKKGWVNKAKRFLEGFEYPPDLSHARWRIFGGDLFRQDLFTGEALKEIETPASAHILALFRKAGNRQPVNRSLYVDLKSYLCDDILVKVDRMSMAVSLEARVPYLDKELVELAFRIPGFLKVSEGKTKILLKKVAARRVPRDCVYRPKEGFSIPIKNWLGSELRPLMEECLGKNRIRQNGIFRADTIERLKREHLSGLFNHSHILWTLIMFHAWEKRWLRN